MKRLAPALITIALAVVIGGGLLCLSVWEKTQSRADMGEDEPYPGRLTIVYQGQEYVYRDRLETFLIIGLDKYSEKRSDPEYFLNNQQADFLLVMIVDKADQSYCALHVNRDTMAEIYRLGLGGKRIDSFTGQLALAHTYGSGGRDSCRNTAKAVSRFLYGIPIDHYFSLTMDAIPELNDMVGGVTVHIDDDFSAVDRSLVQGTDVRLKGNQALTFIRARGRMADKSNINRMSRQRAYMDALYKQMTAKLRSQDGFAAKLATNLADYTVSDLSTMELASFADQFKDYNFTGIRTIDGEAVVGEEFMEFYPDEEALQELIVRLFFEKR